jgi:hypothetical protein
MLVEDEASPAGHAGLHAAAAAAAAIIEPMMYCIASYCISCCLETELSS